MREERADTIKMDELWASLDGQSDEEKASTYLEIVEVLMEHERYASALPLIDIAIELERSHHGDEKHPHVGEAIIAKAFCSWHMSETDRAVELLEEGLTFQSMLSSSMKVDRFQTLAAWYSHLGRRDDMLRVKKDLVELYEDSEETIDLGLHLQSLALAYFQLGQFADAHACALRSHHYLNTIEQTLLAARSEILLGACQAEIGEIEEGLERTTKAIEIVRHEEGEDNRDPRALYFQGLTLLRAGQFEGARDFLLEARSFIALNPEKHEIEIKISIEKELAATYALLDETQNSGEINERLQLVKNYFIDIFS
ncbi:MAG: hypothetical protein WCI25_04510 [Actinomycetes bacterium]